MGKTIHLSGFPSSVTAQEVKEFLEQHTGEGTVFAIKIRPNRSGGQRANATVQFTSNRHADSIISLANVRLWYGRSYLKAWEMERDIVPKPRTFLHSLENIILHFGCQISNEKFSILWRAVNVSVNFGTGLRKFQFVLSLNSVEYKLELSYENIWQIELHRPRGQTAKYLLIQLFGAPRIYEKDSRPSDNLFENPLFNFCKDIPDDQWVRGVDFTPSCCIGQSSSLCLELPYGHQLPDFRENFAYYKESEGRYILESGSPFSCNLDLVPIVGPSPGVDLPYKILFKINSLVQNGCLAGPTLDDLSPRASSANEDRKTGIYKRILSVLRNGIVFAGKKFETLAFSSSQLRDNSIWMFASRDGLTAADIRDWMGNFCHIRNVAKYAARLGQSFGSSTETLTVHAHEIEIIPDVELKWGGVNYVFSDGIGKISAEFAKKVALKCGFKGSHPSAFQIRYGGYKGVVAVDPTSPMKLSLRKSMCKYEADNHKKLDVLAFSKFQPCFLNRQLISLLSTLGVKDNVFENKQRQAIEQLDAILRDPLKAQEALDLMSPGENTNILKEMLMCGYKPDAEPFLAMMLQTFRASKLLELRTKTRIFIPDGRAMMGCLDETGTLEYGQVFVQFSGTRHRQSFNDSIMFGDHGSDQHFLVTGKVVVAKNPCLHPGDVRVLMAVNVPALYHLVDCVVFPQKGLRPHPNECSGSDLDGDIYFVCWDPELIPPWQNEPMDYSPAKSMQLDHDVTIEEVEEYFVNYIVNDSLGIIANAHTAFADSEPQKAMSGPCIELAKLFSIAVDFPKTGVPAEIPRELRVKDYPDFMDKPDKPTYESHNVIGKLYREVKDIAPKNASFTSFTVEMARRSYDPDMEVDGFEDFVDDAFFYKNNYDYKLGNLMDYYGIKTEAEILSGNIIRMAKSFTKRRDAEAINVSIKSLRKEARAWFNEKGSGLDSGAEEVYAKASAWYYVTYHPSYWGSYNEGMDRDHFLSFPWCVYDKLVRIKKNKTSITRALYMSSLEHQLSRELHL